MDHRQLVVLVSRWPPLWDRSHDKFRDQCFKANVWNKIGLEINSTGPACREAFKALREKYIREREKLVQYGVNYRPWELLDYLQFLDPYIITRKSGQGWTTPQSEEFVLAIKQDPSCDDVEDRLREENDLNGLDLTTSDFFRALIKLVRDSRAVWDRHSKDYHDKTLKDRLWKTIAQTLKSDVNSCALRWKGLREKYIRQKQKFTDGDTKWEFLDDLSFLDSVIQYRKKHWQIEEASNMFATSDNSCALSQANSDYELLDDRTNESSGNQPSSSTNNIYQQTLDLCNSSFSVRNVKPHTPDSTLDVRARKRSASDDNSESQYGKRDKSDERTTEQIFGELVASMLANKGDVDKNIAMVQIISILTKP